MARLKGLRRPRGALAPARTAATLITGLLLGAVLTMLLKQTAGGVSHTIVCVRRVHCTFLPRELW